MIPLAIVGCGGMGHRHLFGLAELKEAGWTPFDLVAVCDPVRANAESLAAEAERLMGKRPVLAESLAELKQLGVEAIDITTTPRFHHALAVEGLELGLHMMVEKPFGLTVRACNTIMRAAQESKSIVAVAENYRRDPINRLARALIDAGAIGRPRFAIQQTMGGGDQMLISVWRHQKTQSGVLIDVGVHYTDMLEYLLGPITSVYAQTRLHEPIRHNPAAADAAGLRQGATSNPGGVYGRWQKQMPASFEATADDAAYATFSFASGAVAHYIEDHASHGQPRWSREIYGSTGSLILPDDRTGLPIRLHRGSDEVLEGDQLLELVPDLELDDVTAGLFGGKRLGSYNFSFNEIDRKLLAVEYADFGEALVQGRAPEVDGMQGTRAVAAAYGMLESSIVQRPVSMDEMLNEAVDSYQQEINISLGL
jgi:predicted dehydrogenase